MKKKYQGISIRCALSLFLYLLFFTLMQVEEGQELIKNLAIVERIASFEDIYRLEDAGILWYNSFADTKR